MDERERKVIAFLLKIVYQLACGSLTTDLNQLQQIENLMDEFGSHELSEKEFRY